MRRLSAQLLESTYKPPPPSAFAKRNIKKKKPVYDATKRYRIMGVKKDLVPQCQVCGTKIRKCVILFDDLSHDEVIVGSDCAAIMTGWTLGQVERKAKKAQQDRDREEKQAAVRRITNHVQYKALKVAHGNWLDHAKRKDHENAAHAKAQIDKRLAWMERDLGITRHEILNTLKEYRGWWKSYDELTV